MQVTCRSGLYASMYMQQCAIIKMCRLASKKEDSSSICTARFTSLSCWTSTDNCKQYMAVQQYTAVVWMHDGQAHPYICMQQLTYIYILILYIVSTYHRYYANVMTSCMQLAYFMSCIIMFIYECTCTHMHVNLHIRIQTCIFIHMHA